MVIVNPNPFPFTADAPTLVGQLYSIDRYLKQPTELLKVISDLSSQQFVTPYVFRSTGANGGHILYDVATAQDLYINADANLQPASLVDGTSFPEVATDELTSKIATAIEYGGQFHLTYAQVRRDSRDILGRKLTRLSNTMIKQADVRNLSAVLAAATAGDIVQYNATSNWAVDATQSMVADVSTAIATIESSELNYTVDTALAHPLTLAKIGAIKALWQYLPRESTMSPLLNKQLNGYLGLNWVSARSWPQNKLLVFQRGILGAVAAELPPFVNTVDEPLLRQWTVLAGRAEVPIITDPTAAVLINTLFS